MDLDSACQWLHSSPTLLSFPSLPSPELDDLNLDMDLGPGPGMSVSPSRRSVTSLPLFDESDYAYELESPQHALTISPPESPAPSLMPNALCLGLDVSVDHIPNKRPSILDAFTSAELRARLPPYLPQEELDGLLSVRARAHATLAECVAAPPASCAPTILDHELRRNVPRDAGEPRRRRKRAKELGLEADALIGFALGILPDSSTDKQRSGDDIRQGVRREKAGLVELANLSELVARMILRRRERCGVRGLEGSALQTRCWTGSPLWQSDGEHMLEAKEQVRRSVRRRGL
ncbi:hypothetical protein C8F01DRAFT_413473 [Mycena amicta]|nr:hypothetical protein C8F01DRAFT_413473 [Mycena amicta]